MNQATGLGEEIRTDAQDVQSYIRDTIYNLITSSHSRRIASDFFTLIKYLTLETLKEAEEALKENIREDERQGEKGFDRELYEEEPMQEEPKELDREELSRREEQQIDEIRYRLNDFLKQIRKKPEYQKFIQNFFKYSQEIYDSVQTMNAAPPSEALELQLVLNEAMELLGDFAGKKLVTDFRVNVYEIFKDFKEDEDINAWVSESKEYFLKMLEKPEMATEEDSIKRVKELIGKGRRLLRAKNFPERVNKVSNQISIIFERIKNDPAAADFGDKLRQLASDLVMNRKGQPDFLVMEESLSQIKSLLVQVFKKLLSSLTIQTVQVYSADYDVVLDNLVVSGTGFAPKEIEIGMNSVSILDFENINRDVSTFQLKLKVKNVKPVFKNFKFFYERKTFPTISDYGTADLAIGGRGLNIGVVLTVNTKPGKPAVAKLTHLGVHIDRVDLQIGQPTKHDILDTLLTPIFEGILKDKLEGAVFRFLASPFEEMIDQINEFFLSPAIIAPPMI